MASCEHPTSTRSRFHRWQQRLADWLWSLLTRDLYPSVRHSYPRPPDMFGSGQSLESEALACAAWAAWGNDDQERAHV